MMDNLVLNTSETAHWHTLICDAEQTCHTHLGETLQSYLVFYSCVIPSNINLQKPLLH